MTKKLLLLSLAGMLLISCDKTDETIQPVPFNQVTLTDGFWKDRMETELKVTVPFSVEQSAPALERFRRCAALNAGEKTELPQPHRFISSDMYKVMEGVAYSLMIEPNAELEAWMDEAIDLIGKSQKEDGYLYITHIAGNPFKNEMGEKPYTWIVHSHELYNVGHMYEAAVAYYQATGKRELLDIAIKSAKHVNKVIFEGGDPNYNDGKPIMQAPGHEEIELALCKMYRITGDKLYLEMAKKFLDIRGVTYVPDGEGVMAPTYAQQHAPVADQREAVGHAVRAAYLYTAMAQVDALMGTHDYDKALNAIWNNLTSTRMHITGGLGAVQGMEGFGAEYELPNITAYNETCAAVANVFFNHSLYLNTGDAKFLDIAELSLFNNSLAGVNLAGDRFFYVNPLETDGNRPFNHGVAGRAPWFGCACCPPNISRLILQVPSYMYAFDSKGLYLTLYGSSKTTIALNDVNVALEQTSGYPFVGDVKLVVNPEKAARFNVNLRIPTWAQDDEFVPGGLYHFIDGKEQGFTLRINGKDAVYTMKNGFAVISREWKAGDVVELVLPIEARMVDCSDNVPDNIGRTAVTRGPLVYCAEESDNNTKVQNLYLGGTDKKLESETISGGILDGLVKVSFDGMSEQGPQRINLIPYYAWDNREDNQSMVVWMNNEKPHNMDVSVQYWKQVKNVMVFEGRQRKFEGNAICDGTVASSSSDLSKMYLSVAAGSTKEVEVQFTEEMDIESISLYYLEDSQKNIAAPSSWSIKYRENGQWKDMKLYVTDEYRTYMDQFNLVHPAKTIKTDALRIVVTPAEGKTVAISEMIFE